MDENIPDSPLATWAQAAFAELHKEVLRVLPPVLQPLWETYNKELPGHELYPVRPYLHLLTARHYGCQENQSLKLAASIYMIHIASNLHDRLGAAINGKEAYPLTGQETIGSSPESLDILLGDFFFSMSSNIIVSVGDFRIIEDTIKTSGASAETQATLVSLDSRLRELQADECFNVAVDKVALLFGLSLRMGAMLGHASEIEEQAFSDFGHLLGRAYKIVQDVQFWQSPPGFGPQITPEKKFSHPLIRLWQQKGHQAWLEATSQLNPFTEETWSKVKHRLEKSGYLEDSIKTAKDIAKQAAERLTEIPESEPLQTLKAIASVDLMKGWQ